jgi:hypothetical protein
MYKQRSINFSLLKSHQMRPCMTNKDGQHQNTIG